MGVYLTSLQTRLRAAETGKYVARATNTGITQIVNPYGRVIAKARPFHREILTTDVRLSHGTTPYSRYGDKPMMMIIFAAWCYVWVSKRKRISSIPRLGVFGQKRL
jgi:apolipoprotein N-acyltransferase